MTNTRTINETNYHDATSANFRAMRKAPERTPDFVSPSGSRYWHTEEGLIRQSNHWNRGIRSCSWFLGGREVEGRTSVGFCAWSEFVDKEAGEVCPAHQKLIAKGQKLWERYEAWKTKLVTPGAKVRAVRTVKERIGRGRSAKFVTRTQEVSFRVAKSTKAFVITTDGDKFALSTLTRA